MSEAFDAGADSADCPLYVDLDGTLVATDTLWESLLALLRERPLLALATPFWLLSGRARFKRRLAERVVPDAASLPYREELVAFLVEERRRGRRLVLATASDERVARAVAAHLGLFDGLLASDGERNLAGPAKAAAIRAERAAEHFDYVGNSAADLPVWEAARKVYAVGAPPGLLRRLGAREPVRVFPAPGGGLRAVLRALRPHQWAKNLLVFVPLALTPHALGDLARGRAALLAFAALCLVASAGYVANDLLDLHADRGHPAKRRRPFASGELQLATGLALVALLAGAGFGVALLGTARPFVAWLAAYLGLSLAYSLQIKRLPLVDVIWLAGLYTLRVVAGAAAVAITPTPWLLAFSMFIFLSLAFAKRYSELRLTAERRESQASGRAYRVDDLDLVLSLGSSSGYLSVLVLCLYINSDLVQRLYHTVAVLWLLVPVLLFWISRIWFLAKRGELPGDPVAFAVRDPVSLATGALMAAILAAAIWL
jgi:4-hydroxybenzoate polyprenyltransferase/phosphoserine phosphatase